MDWIEEKLLDFANTIRRMSLRRALLGYLFIGIFAAGILAFVTESALINRALLMESRAAGRWFTEREVAVLKCMDMLKIVLPFVYLCIAVMIAAILFYQFRLKKPFQILRQAAEAIRMNNLDIEVSYGSRDEMGQLCDSFEAMRQEVIKNKEEMWRLIEDQREINAAFAHDLRTPLTVLRGYSDFLYRFIPEGRLSEEKLLDTLRLMSEHIRRLESYSRTMKNIRNFEEIEPKREETDILRLQSRIQELGDALNEIGEVKICLSGKLETSQCIWADENLIMEVLENLVSNAIRFAKSRVEIFIETEEAEKLLIFYVHDDGPGFSDEELEKAVLPYFQGNDRGKKEEQHFGIGLHIASILCKKHGGTLSIADSIYGGALVSVSFSYRKS